MKSSKTEFYKQMDLAGRIDNASSVQLIQMMYDGAVSAARAAEIAIDADDLGRRSDAISKCMGIIAGLRDSLDMDVDSDFPETIDSLYDYMQRRLLVANKDNQVEPLREVVELLSTVKGGWDQLAAQGH